jgi:hypothetical protein
VRRLAPFLAAEQLPEPLLLLPGPSLEPRDVAVLDQPVEGGLDGIEVGERVQPLAALLELARRLRAAEHQYAQQRQVVAPEA